MYIFFNIFLIPQKNNFLNTSLDAAIVVGMIMLAESGGGFKVEGSDGTKERSSTSTVDFPKKRILAFIGLALVCIFFSLLLSVFRTKAQGYPYRYFEFKFL